MAWKWNRKGLLLVAAGLAMGYFYYQRYRIAPDLEFQKFQGKTLNGLRWTPQTGGRNYHVFQFFATWCVDCRRELPQWAKLESERNQRNIGLTFFTDEDATLITPFAKAQKGGMDWVVLDRPFRDFGIYSLPTLYVFDTHGKLVFRHAGPMEINADFLNRFQ